MALLPKQIEEIRAKRAQLKSRRKERLDLEATDPEVINNSVTEDSKPQGQSKLPSLILKQGQKLGKLFIPLAINLIKKYGIDQAKQEIESQELSIEDLQEKFCPPNLTEIVQKRNDAVDYLNKTGDRLDSLSITVNFGGNFAGLIQGLVNTINSGKTLANTAMSFIPFALPGAVPAAINVASTLASNLTFNEDGTPKLPPLTITASQVSPSVASTQSTILKSVALLSKLDVLINLCNPNAILLPLNDSIQNVVANEALAEISSNDTTYRGFIIEIETKPYTDRVNQNRAVGKNRSGIIMIATEYSFASDPQVLITELKFIIDRDNLKAY
tara:strand:+ start:2958 stop:3944 length:987 start_codon:yes stop_codon:yes gene_type:complete